jgi:hypothetical protein
MLEFTFCELKKVFRQEDEIFANLLSRVRRGEQRAGNEIVEYVESQRKIGSDDIRRFEMKLFSKNKDVNAFNTLKLNELETEAQIYKAIDSEEPCVDISDNRYNDYCKSLKGNWRHLKEIRAEEIVELKVDCEIMMLLNTSVPGTTASDGEPRRLANGSRGKIIKFDIPDEEAMKSHVEKLEKEKKDTNKRDIDLLNRQLDWVKRAAQEKKRIPYVLFKGFEEAIPILPMEFSFDTSGLGKNVRLQIPIKLAFAITVHKSQGMSLDSCSVDASNVFAPAQVYVALSRCRSAAGLQIENLNSSKIKAPQDALDFYDHLRDPNKYPPNTYKWWQYSPMMNEKEKAANKILRQYYEPIKDKNENGCFSEFLSVKHNRMGKRAGDELLKEEPDANWKCKACNNKRQYSLECCFLVRERRNMHHQKTPCPECPKSGGPEACPKCSPLNFCFLPAHGNSSDGTISKAMCPKCTPDNFCRDTGHGNSEESPAHKSSCVKCSHDYFNSSVPTPQTTEPPSSLPRPDCDDEDTRIATRTTTRSRSEADDEDDGDLEHNIKRQRMLNELGRQELQTINLQIELMERRNRLAQLQENET